MSTRNPSLQTRSQYQNFWGVYGAANLLPNASGFALVAAKFTLEAGDFAYVTGSGMYQCDAPGTAGGADATWSQIGAGGATQDRFAPSHLVGNVPAGDSATAYSSAGFNYYPDVGNGAQLQAALTAAAPTGDLVYVRRGIYNLNVAGAPAGPIVANSPLIGEGTQGTQITARTAGNQGALVCNGAQLRGLSLACLTADPGSAGSDAVLRVPAAGTMIEQVRVVFATDPAGQLKEGIRIDGTTGTGDPIVSLSDVEIVATTATGSASPTICLRTITAGGSVIVDVQNVHTDGGDIGVRSEMPFIGQDLQALDWELVGLQSVGTPPVRLSSSRISPASLAAPGAIGVTLESNDADFSGVVIQTTGIGHTAAVRVSRIGSQSTDNTFRGLTCSGFDFGFELGRAADNSTVGRTFIDNCSVTAGSVGVRVATQSADVKITDSSFTVAVIGTGVVLAGINVETGTSNVLLDGNSVTITDLLNAAYGIRHRGTGSTVHCRVFFSGCAWGAEIDAADADCSHNTIIGDTNGNVDSSLGALHLTNQARIRAIGNFCDFQQSVFTNPAVLVEGSLAQCSLNTTVVTAGASSPGIRLSATSVNCNVLGNICQSSASVAGYVEDLGTTNNLALNIGT